MIRSRRSRRTQEEKGRDGRRKQRSQSIEDARKRIAMNNDEIVENHVGMEMKLHGGVLARAGIHCGKMTHGNNDQQDMCL